MKVTVATIALTAVLAARSASATPITFTFTSSLLTAAPGTSVTFQANIANPLPPTAFLNGDSVTVSSPLIADDTLFFLNTPPFLASGQSVTAVPILTVKVPSTTIPGPYGGTFNILGGPTDQDFDVLASQPFSVSVTPVPEPGTVSLLVLGLVYAAGRRWHPQR
jgi:hypothetical protein